MAGYEGDLEAIVREVLSRLQQLGGEQAGGPAASREAGGTPPPRPTASPAGRSDQLQLEQRTITLGLVQGRLRGVKEVLVPAGAVVTPSVRDELRKRQIPLRVQNPATDAARQPAGLVLGVAGPTAVAEAALAVVQAESAAAKQIAGDCVLDVVQRVTQIMGDDNQIGLVLTDRPAVALCLANRQRRIRAAWGVNAAAVRQSAQLIGANLLVVDPSQHGLYELRGIIRAFVDGPHACSVAYRSALGDES
jgi:hypothetical protein